MTKSRALTISKDGYIRLSFQELQRVRFHHLMSGLDEAATNKASFGATQATISGYTEWLSDTAPQITIGWDWLMEFVDGRVRLRQIGSPRSNIMLQAGHNEDVGQEKSLLLQELRIDELGWQSVVMEQISKRYR